MVLRKPYAFIIKHFKLIHLILCVLIVILITNTLETANFLNNFLNSELAYINKSDYAHNFSLLMIILPIVLFIIFTGLFGILYLKQKPKKLYLFSLIGISLVFALNLYVRGTMYSMISTIVSVQTLKILSDFLVFSVIGLSILFISCLLRGIGFNISHFDFNEDINAINVEEKDREEVELQINLDPNDIKRKINKTKRTIRYAYKEHKGIFKATILLFVMIILGIGTKIYLNGRIKVSGRIITTNEFRFKLIDSYIVNTDIHNNILTNNNLLLVIKAEITNLNKENKKAFNTGTLSVTLDGDSYSNSFNYDDYVKDIGTYYLNNELGKEETKEVVFTFLIPRNHVNSAKYLTIRNLNTNKNMNIQLNPINLYDNKKEIIESNKEIKLDQTIIKDTDIIIEEVDIQNKFKIDYSFKYSSNLAFNSHEYVVPKKLDSNNDKAILKLKVKYNNDKSQDIYYLIKNYGSIEYEVNGTKYIQYNGLNQVKPNNDYSQNIYYLEVNRNMLNASKITLIFKIRNIEYRCILK